MSPAEQEIKELTSFKNVHKADLIKRINEKYIDYAKVKYHLRKMIETDIEIGRIIGGKKNGI